MSSEYLPLMSKFGDNLLSARVKSISPRHIQPQPQVNILTKMLKFSIFSIYCDTLEEVVKKFIHMMNPRKIKNGCKCWNKRTLNYNKNIDWWPEARNSRGPYLLPWIRIPPTRTGISLQHLKITWVTRSDLEKIRLQQFLLTNQKQVCSPELGNLSILD